MLCKLIFDKQTDESTISDCVDESHRMRDGVEKAVQCCPPKRGTYVGQRETKEE